MNHDIQFCRDLSLQASEPLIGSAPHGAFYITITWPKSCWKKSVLASSGLPEEFVDWHAEQVAYRGQTLIRMIAQANTTDTDVEICIYPTQTRYLGVPPQNIISVLENHFQQNPVLAYQAPFPTVPRLLVCTHGQYDQCCAKYGQSIFQYFRDYCQMENLPLEVWQSTHIGGHRFAATAIVFPSGHTYGRIEKNQVPTIVHSILENRIFLPAYRGNFHLPSLEQTIEAYATKYFQKQVDSVELQLQSIEKHDSYVVAHVKRANAEDECTLTLVQKEFIAPSSCDQIESVTPKLRWVLDSMQTSPE